MILSTELPPIAEPSCGQSRGFKNRGTPHSAAGCPHPSPPANFRPVSPSDVSIIHGDCRTALAGVEPGSVDLVIADPPYGITKLEWDRDVKGWIKAMIP